MPPLNLGARLIILISLIVAMALSILPLPRQLFLINPDWVALCLIYWIITLPDRVGLTTAWLTGLFTDALTGRLLGQHAIAYVVIAYLCLRGYRRLRLYPIPQQSMWVLAFLLANQLLILWTQSIRNNNAESWLYWLPALTGALLWPLVMVTLRELRRYFRIH